MGVFIHTHLFPHTTSYKRFEELILQPVYTNLCRQEKCMGIAYRGARAISGGYSYNVVARGESSKGWFYGFKLHLLINDKGKLCSFCFSAGTRDERNYAGIERKTLRGSGYIVQELFERLYEHCF